MGWALGSASVILSGPSSEALAGRPGGAGSPGAGRDAAGGFGPRVLTDRPSVLYSTTMPSPLIPIPSRPGFHKDVFDAPGADPIVFLSSLEGESRGYWGRQDQWVAWGGALARIEVTPGVRASRFDAVRSEARRIFRRIYTDWGSVPFRERPRFFGGFSFRDGSGGEAIWSGFPPAGFILPRVILEARGGETRLRVAGITPWGMPGSDPETERLAARVLAALRASAPGRRPAWEFDGAALERPHPSVAGPPEEDGEGGPEDPERSRWKEAVESVLREVGEGTLRKAVLARVLDAEFPRSVDSLSSLEFLRAENRRAHVYLFEPHTGDTFLGAAPEILAELRRGRFRATAVAGSIPRGGSDDEDHELALTLLESEKDRIEHELTAREMVAALMGRLSEMEVEEEPRVLALARIQHLETKITGLAAPGEDILSLVEALHPTPAVCGSPREAARPLIRAAEPFDRGWYAGPVGWFDLAGEGDFGPALRAAIGAGRRWRLFAGAGIVEGSSAEAEWAETALKFEPALRALRVGAGEAAEIV